MRDSYQDLVKVVSGLLYGYDPGGMGSTVFAPEDEYDAPAQHLVAALVRSSNPSEVGEVVRSQYQSATDGLCEATSSALALYRTPQAGPRTQGS